MMPGGMHRNSRFKIIHRRQKRFYNQDYVYFITTVTGARQPYFKEELFCKLLVENLKFCKKLKKFLLFGFIIIPDHVHLLLKPNGKFNISQIMQSIKQNVSCDINRVISSNNEGETPASRLQGIYCKKGINLFSYKNLFIKKYGKNPNWPAFRWQQSFHDHVIRNEKDFYKHLNYIALNCVKHNICQDEENYKWSFLNREFDFLIDDF